MSTIAPVAKDVAARHAALEELLILDTAKEPVFVAIAALAAAICETAIALISLVDRHRQWFKARVGLDVRETPREVAFCAHAILNPEMMEVPDAASDPRFGDNPLVLDESSYAELRPYIEATLRGEMTSVGGHASVDGRPCWFRSDYIPDRETDGRVRGFYALTFDVTTQKTAERLAATSEHRLRLICDNVPAAVCYIDEQRCYRYNNAA